MNYYELLEIEVTATTTQIKAAYRKKAKQHHPDHGGDPELFKEIQAAYECLSSPEEREFYDLTGAAKGSDIMNKVASIIREAINNNKPIKTINESLNSARADCNIRIRQLSEKRVKLEKVLEKITSQNSSHKLYPVFVGVIRAELASTEEQQKSFELGIAEITQLQLMFSGLKEEPEQPTGFSFSSARMDSKHLQDMLAHFNRMGDDAQANFNSEYSNNPDNE